MIHDMINNKASGALRRRDNSVMMAREAEVARALDMTTGRGVGIEMAGGGGGGGGGGGMFWPQEMAVLDRPVERLKVSRPKIKSEPPKPLAVEPRDMSQMEEYAALAASVGVAVPDLEIERLKAFLNKRDIPVFSLPAVVAYMDQKAREESKDMFGWAWHPLRQQDKREINFGTVGVRQNGQTIQRASDFYYSKSSVYDRVIPIHALRKVALIAKEFGDRVAFMVSDYALAPHIDVPDPFLMAVIANPRVGKGEGRFVIDFWAEPGFGIMEQVK